MPNQYNFRAEIQGTWNRTEEKINNLFNLHDHLEPLWFFSKNFNTNCPNPYTIGNLYSPHNSDSSSDKINTKLYNENIDENFNSLRTVHHHKRQTDLRRHKVNVTFAEKSLQDLDWTWSIFAVVLAVRDWPHRLRYVYIYTCNFATADFQQSLARIITPSSVIKHLLQLFCSILLLIHNQLLIFTARRKMSVCLSVRHTPVLSVNGYIYPQTFFHHPVALPS